MPMPQAHIHQNRINALTAQRFALMDELKTYRDRLRRLRYIAGAGAAAAVAVGVVLARVLP